MTSSILKIRAFPDPILRKISAPVDKIDENVRAFIQKLERTMESQPGGIGIAAPQVGVLKQIAIVDVTAKIPEAKRIILINPIILERSEETIVREGCMSLAHYTANINRANRIRVEWVDFQMRRQGKITTGLEAVCIQHEVDHLNGMLFLDRVGCLNSDVFRRKRYL